MTISKPILYVSLLAVVVYAATLPKGDDAARKPAKTTKPAVKKSGEIEITEEDLKAHFASYASQPKDAFLPKVIPVSAITDKKNPNAANGKWTLTGVNTVDGVTSAVLENESTHDIQILKKGDTFNGAQVVSIEPLAVNFVTKLNQVSRLTFVEPEPTKEAAPPPVANNNRNPFAAFAAAASGGGDGSGGGMPNMNGSGAPNMAQGGAAAPADSTLETPNTGRRGGGRRNREGN